MAKSRYANLKLIDGRYLSTWSTPVRSRGLKELNLLENVRSFEYTIKVGDRADHLAARFLGEDLYWWVICLINNIDYPFASGGWTPGRTIRIPYDVADVLEKLQR